MNVNRSVWHFRLLNMLDMLSEGPETLCKYFWKVVFAATVTPVLTLGALWVATLPLWWSFVGSNALVGFAIIVAMLDIAALSLVLINMILLRHDNEIMAGTREAPVKKVKVPKTPSLFSQWLKAKHRQVCPIIEFVNDKQGG